MSTDKAMVTDALTRPIIGIENRTAQEAFDIMCDRIRRSAALAQAEQPVAWMHPTANWSHTDYDVIRRHCFNEGPMPVPLFLRAPVQTDTQPFCWIRETCYGTLEFAEPVDGDTHTFPVYRHPPAKREARETAPPGTPSPQSHLRGLTDLETELLSALKLFRDTIIGEVHDKWDEGMRAGKLIVALANPTLKYRDDISGIHAAIAKAEAVGAATTEGSADE